MAETERHGRPIADLIGRMESIQGSFAPTDARRHFHAAYLRTTRAIATELASGGFLDTAWVERWDIDFADLYLDALDAWDRGEAPGPWTVAFSTARDRPDLPPLRHVLFGINAHINYDLPQALLAVITDDEFDDPAVRERRGRDHIHIDTVLSSRVAAEDAQLEGKRSLLDRILTPFNRAGTRRFLAEAREKVWRNAIALSHARRRGHDAYREELAKLEELCRGRVADLVAPGQVLLKLSRKGFGVLLPDA
jgi:hypothetical protein